MKDTTKRPPAPRAPRPQERARAFRDAFFLLDRRISRFISLPMSRLDNLSLKRELDNIGKQPRKSAASAQS